MKISCAMADDLLPLYVDDSCSDDSRAALEEHLSECQSCTEKLRRMKNVDFVTVKTADVENPTASMAAYAKKVRHHKTITAVIVPITIIVLTLVISLFYQAFIIIEHQHTPVITGIETGVYNLTSDNLTCAVDEVAGYTFYTNSTQLVVSMQSEAAFTGRIMLWNVDYSDEYIMVGNISTDNCRCVFSNLTSASRYRITIDGISDCMITVSGSVTFWQAVSMVIDNIF